MNRIIFSFAALLMLVSAPMSQVLILVDEFYKMHDDLLPQPEGHKIDRYMSEMASLDGKNVELMILYRRSMYDYEWVWEKLRDKYIEDADDPFKDTLEGVVLLGDIPVPTFHIEIGDYVSTAPCDYFYMDLWDNRADTTYPDWEYISPTDPNPWERYNGDILNRASYNGDDSLEIWVSRIYATNLMHLRTAGAPWGEFLEEYEIIDAYLDKVHDRMTTHVSVRRGVAMGYPPNMGFRTLQVMSAMDGLNLNELHYMDNMTDLRLNQAAAWQAVLQSGRPGNINYGAFHGSKYTDATYERDCRTNLSGGYYEWAAVFAHSSTTYSGFHAYGRPKYYETAGGFFSVNTIPSWTEKSSGGFNNGKYYEWNLENNKEARAEWSCVIPQGIEGQYAVYMYWDVDPLLNSPESYYNLHGDKNFGLIREGDLNQLTPAGGWHLITDFSAEEFDTLVYIMYPNYCDFTRHNRCVADAVEFRLVTAIPWEPNFVYYPAGTFVSYGGANYKCIQAHTSQPGWQPPNVPALWQQDEFKIRVTPGNLAQPWDPNWVYYPVDTFVSYEYINYRCIQAHNSLPGWQPPAVPALWQPDTTRAISPNDLFDISNRGANGFRLTNWYHRSFCDMQDDGSQSKVLFFEGVACEISNYLTEDNIALLYGMGHAGLTMVGNSFYNWGDNDYTIYTDTLGAGHSFGKAYLDYANRDFPDVRDNFILFGAGTLQALSYP